jgi:GTPase
MKSIIVMLKEDEFEERREEIILLSKTAGYEIVGQFSQDRRPRARYLIGSGKVEEIREFVSKNGVEVVVFENYLDSRQILSLERAIGVPVIDKFDLILNVFERHAKSTEAMLQIELARLKRKIPYVKMAAGRRMRTDHPGFGSSGEYIVHSTITMIHKRIKKIEEKLEKFKKRMILQGKRRKEIGFVCSLVGYTNAGKTTILNALTEEKREAKDELFTTLRTKTASLKTPRGATLFISDTIGFIRNLPHQLIYAFQATLGEIKNSDLILIVMDASDSETEFSRKKEICEKTLVKIRADGIPALYVLNKIDLKDEKDEDESKDGRADVRVSAKFGMGIEELKKELVRICERNKERLIM